MMIIEHKTYLPSFNLNSLHPPQTPVCILTVLSVNEAVRDCAAYRGICPDMSMNTGEFKDAVVESVRAGGNKISGAEARQLFPEIEEMGLRYRP
ncbi:MAG: hypothetical protein COB08_014855 [Rhodobacteraceae bacterium]|nr:hypothetical protein [Paracoccaceae bacterium]